VLSNLEKSLDMTVTGFDDTPSYDICTTWDGNMDLGEKDCCWEFGEMYTYGSDCVFVLCSHVSHEDSLSCLTLVPDCTLRNSGVPARDLWLFQTFIIFSFPWPSLAPPSSFSLCLPTLRASSVWLQTSLGHGSRHIPR